LVVPPAPTAALAVRCGRFAPGRRHCRLMRGAVWASSKEGYRGTRPGLPWAGLPGRVGRMGSLILTVD